MNPATTKLAQVATGSKRCERCGKVHPLETWPLHPRWKRPLSICGGCLSESRAVAGKKNAARLAAKREERKREKAKAAIAPPPPAPKQDTPSVQLLFAKLEGYALGKDDQALTDLLQALEEAMNR